MLTDSISKLVEVLEKVLDLMLKVLNLACQLSKFATRRVSLVMSLALLRSARDIPALLQAATPASFVHAVELEPAAPLARVLAIALDLPALALIAVDASVCLCDLNHLETSTRRGTIPCNGDIAVSLPPCRVTGFALPLPLTANVAVFMAVVRTFGRIR